ncbi:trans-aconitate 2-methyltransferase [Actinomadura barringtoniae]|uniref:Trans-aconitate 2-methyltransferase n=1 Tax=Actinomadura barringtoniae TaxID=1427535 RepID=A0A939P7N0_9ACTN|nr:trans-aconitate 2-methyltransferase [Actinomadura barringtoniae]MBO2447015.1 trans-aconitate 2-methyltransferase [Actinomadura barringtoniae]
MSRQVSGTWDPAQYGVFGDERARPFFELLGRVDVEKPRRIVDLGCGSGELTATLRGRWPDADIEAIDSSPEMIAAAPEVEGIRFSVGDVESWRPGGSVDLIVSNAVLQWVPTHAELIPEWIGALSPGGRLAFQVPGNFDAPSHRLLRELCSSERWRGLVGDALRVDPVMDPGGYLDLLARRGCFVDAWETTYAQVLQGEDPVLEWVKGTALRPVLSRLGEGEAQEFLNEFGALLREAYPSTPYGTVFPFRRIFVVAGRDGP